MKSKLFLPFVFILFLFSSCNEISQWRGTARDGIYSGTNLLKEWPKEGPERSLKIENIGKGFSQPVVYNEVIYVSGLKSDTLDMVSAFDMQGNLLWDKVYSKAWPRSYPESRGTPTIEKNRIYLIGGKGNLICLSTNGGKVLWEQNPLKEFGGEIMHWGIVESVLLTDKAALYVTGGEETTLVAYHKRSGKLLWKSKSLGDAKSYASSALVEWGGLKIVLVQTDKHLIGFNAENGDILWTHDTAQYHTKKGKGEAANTPLFKDGDIFITYGNDHPGMLFRISDDGKSIRLKWQNDILDTHHGGLVLLNGAIYGSNMIDNTRGNWASVDWETGNTNWETNWFTKGSVISADDMLYFYEEKGGNIALVKPDTSELKIVSTFCINEGEGPHWAHPSIYNGFLFVRHGSVLLVYNISA